jgi:sulfur-carrier protein
MHLKEIEVHYFAILREQRGTASERVSTAATTPGELYAEISGRHHFSLAQHQLQVAVNDSFADWNTLLHDRDQVVFLPPVSGG